MNKVGIYFAYWTRDWKADFLYYIEKVARLGFDVLEVSTANMLDMSPEQLGELKKAVEDKEMELTYCIGFPTDKDLASEDPLIRKNGIEYAKRTLEVIYRMGGSVFGGINYSAWPGVLKEGIVDKRPHLERSMASVREVIKTAEAYGITYCAEVVNRFEQYLLNTAAEGVAFAKEIDSPNFKLLLDSFHMNIEEDSIGEAIVTAGDYLGHFHIGETNRKAPGKGRMPWDEIAGALKKINYQGRVVMEPFVKMGGEVGRDIRMWRDLNPGAGEAELDADAKAALEFIRSKL
jgi:D-psicose/D-tagatose/L-ribulose 3-epimerase